MCLVYMALKAKSPKQTLSISNRLMSEQRRHQGAHMQQVAWDADEAMILRALTLRAIAHPDVAVQDVRDVDVAVHAGHGAVDDHGAVVAQALGDLLHEGAAHGVDGAICTLAT